MAREGVGLFAAFRVLGRFSGPVPHVLRYHGRHREFYLAAAVGRSVHTYNVKKLGIVAVSNTLPEDITCLAADRMLIFASYDNILHAFARNKEVVHTYEGHNARIHLLQPFGDHIISVDVDNVLIVWNIQSEEVYLQMDFDKATFAVSALLHPSTYLNKILIGSEQGTLQLWNIRSKVYNGLQELLDTSSNQSFEGVQLLETDFFNFLQAPAVDVVAVGLVSGHIIVHNIKYDETLMKFQQDWGPITAISFRTDGHPVMAAGSPVGHIALWDLEEKKLMCQMQDAHSTAIAGMTFVPGEPLLITNGADNALRVWIFDGPGGTGRILRSRMGHSAPPTKIRYHGQNGKQILSAGSINKKKSKKKGLKLDTMALPPITSFASEVAHQNDWDGIVACHQGYITCTTWNYQKTSMGAHKLRPEEFSKHKPVDIYATAVDITSCGNFAVIGMSTGQVDVYNMQSGIHRGRYGKETGIAFDDFTISVLDVETRKIVRTFSGHHGQINDMTFSPDGRWLITSSMDCSIKTWDLPSGCLIDCFLVDSAAVSLTMSPTGDFLASAHVDDLGIYLWSNRSLYSLVSLRPLPADYEPSLVTLPSTCQMQDMDVSGDEEPCDEMIEYVSPEQLGQQLVTLSLLPESRWKNLINLDIIKSKVVNFGVLAQKSDFYIHLEEALSTNESCTMLTMLRNQTLHGVVQPLLEKERKRNKCRTMASLSTQTVTEETGTASMQTVIEDKGTKNKATVSVSTQAVTEEKETKGAISISTQTVTEAEQPKPVAVAPVQKKKSKSKSVRIVTDEDVAGPSHPAEETELEIITHSLSLGELCDLWREFTCQTNESILTWLIHIWDTAANDTILMEVRPGNWDHCLEMWSLTRGSGELNKLSASVGDC
ncbi:hypothetical protein DUI87_30774 [Hirundo rustica rustica]|uniref:Small-subunit processome Utp21 domain-containing protein n=1 Tax=Hirundo rustica rustica TaxID=333673 RepID=A0A3M0IY48_HIRRU|nr:hypothetical protein DUI87_30774 [Hirundo rustica rustica]